MGYRHWSIAIDQLNLCHLFCLCSLVTLFYAFCSTLSSVLMYVQLLKIKKSTARNELSYETEHHSEEADTFGQMLSRRIQVTVEVAVSKIFPAGK